MIQAYVDTKPGFSIIRNDFRQKQLFKCGHPPFLLILRTELCLFTIMSERALFGGCLMETAITEFMPDIETVKRMTSNQKGHTWQTM